MSEMLSQEEIDALLNGEEDKVLEKHIGEMKPPISQYLSTIEQDALGEIGNICFGSSATALSTLLNQKVEITTPTISLVENANLEDEFPQPHVAIRVSFTEGFSGVNLFIIKNSDAAIIADLMLGGDGRSPEADLNEIHLSAVQEAMNQMMGSAATSMSTIFNKRVDISPPSINILDVNSGEGKEYIPEEEIFVKVSFQLKVGELIDSNIMQLLPIHFAKDFVNELLQVDDVVEEPAPTATNVPSSRPNGQMNYTNEPERERANTPRSQPNNHFGESFGSEGANIQSAAFSNFEQQTVLPPQEQQNLDMLLDIPLKVSVELGRTQKTIKEILEMGSGSIVELDKLAGEPVDIHVNDKLIAKGEVVVIDENFGVRVTDILSQSERIKKLR
ncbi:flagellar motor switch protein FliN/FliY [Salirhabdus euzebyi]|uniref:Flagellar motor switch protein FliN/FliY n=2 Tax=Salirhabdus euzebyi TaxID=394506 RepID=A0A841Q3E8_9BACI|nr:flagellar motor switch protein FliN/FliY [Salirhabdus euzebyi]